MSDESDLIQSVYAVTVEPERYDDLVVTWVDKLSTALFAYQDNPGDADAAALNEHVKRATKVIALLASSRADDPVGVAPVGADGGHPEAQPVMRINVAGRLLLTNSAATRAYGVKAEDQLENLPFDVAAQRAIRALATRLLRHKREAPSQNSAVPLVHAVRVDTGQSVYLSLTADAADPAALYLTSTDIVWPDRLTQLMRDSFDLTVAECAVGKGLVEGLSLTGIAADRRSTISTVRVHARSLFSKTATSGQREFIRMAIGLVTLYPDVGVQSEVEGDFDLASVVAAGGVLPLPNQWQTLRTRDGRQLPYAVLGPASGRPCLYVHDALFGPMLPAALVTAASEQGLKIVVFARQGWMGAQRYPAGCNAFEQCALDTKELMQHLQLDGVLLIGRVLGATYAYEILRLDRARYIGLLGISPALPIGEREDINRMAPHHRLLTMSIGKNPTLLKFVTRAGSAIYDRFGADRFLRMVYRSSAEDLAVLDNAQTYAAIEAGLALGGGGARHPFYHELKDRPSSAWHPGLEMPVPFHALLGEKDPSARRRRAERMIELGVPLSLTVLPAVGELFIYKCPQIVVDEIVAMLASIDASDRSRAKV